MKYLIAILTIVFLAGCVEDNQRTQDDSQDWPEFNGMETIEHDGHDYIVLFSMYDRQGYIPNAEHFEHSPDCECGWKGE